MAILTTRRCKVHHGQHTYVTCPQCGCQYCPHLYTACPRSSWDLMAHVRTLVGAKTQKGESTMSDPIHPESMHTLRALVKLHGGPRVRTMLHTILMQERQYVLTRVPRTGEAAHQHGCTCYLCVEQRR